MNFLFMALIAITAVLYALGGEKRMSMICTFRKLYQQAKDEMKGEKREKEEVKNVDSKEPAISTDGVADTSTQGETELKEVEAQ